MTVSVTWSTTNGGNAISTTVDHGDLSNGDTSSGQEIFLRHDGLAVITNVGLYIRQYSGTYGGSATAAADFAEIIAWGDASTASTFGGVQINFYATEAPTGYTSGWPTYDEKTTSYGFVHRTGVGDSEGNAYALPATITGATAEGEIPIGASPNIRFQMKVQVPTAEDTTGIRQFDQVVTYDYTS